MTDAENPHAGQGMVVLDIGGDIGALIVSTPAAMAGVEIEICPTGARHTVPDEGGEWWDGDWHAHGHSGEAHPHDHDGGHEHEHHEHGSAWPHVAVMPRPSPVGIQHTAVYPGLLQGSYDVWVRPDGPTALTVDVVGAEVTMATWPNLA